MLCDVISVVAEFMVSAVHVLTAHPFSVWTEFTVTTGERSERPRGMLLVTRMQELQAEDQTRETQWHPRERERE
jgi:hypothetical protein